MHQVSEYAKNFQPVFKESLESKMSTIGENRKWSKLYKHTFYTRVFERMCLGLRNWTIAGTTIAMQSLK